MNSSSPTVMDAAARRSSGSVRSSSSCGPNLATRTCEAQDLTARATNRTSFRSTRRQGSLAWPPPSGSGGFVVAWIAFPPAKVLFQRFARDGMKIGPETVVSDDHVVADPDRMRGPAIGFTLDGNFVISWVAATPDTQVKAALFDSEAGGRIGPEMVVNSSPGVHFAPTLAAFTAAGLDDVTFAIAWNGGENGIFRSRFQLFNADGSRRGRRSCREERPSARSRRSRSAG